MRVRATICRIFVSLLSASPFGAHAQFPEPDAAERMAIIARMRTAALSYSDQLKDFTCIQLMSRSADNSGTGKHYKPLETQELELDYVAHKEHYKLLKVNGKTTDLEKRSEAGLLQAWR